MLRHRRRAYGLVAEMVGRKGRGKEETVMNLNISNPVVRFSPVCGTSINEACVEAVSIAIRHNSEVHFDFNDVAMIALPTSNSSILVAEWETENHRQHEAWKNSPEGKRAKAEEKRILVATQNKVDALMAKLSDVYQNERKLMIWLGKLAENADHAGIRWDAKRVAHLLLKAGYKNGDACGQDQAEYKNPHILARYIAGQVINCITDGMPPHPMTSCFVKDYLALKP